MSFDPVIDRSTADHPAGIESGSLSNDPAAPASARRTVAPKPLIEVHTAVFEGPFDLLLHLILREQVDIYEITLSTIVDAYLVELERLAELPLAQATEFLVIAATLVELKTRRLLPRPESIDLDEDLFPFEHRDLLLARLLEYKTFKDAAAAMSGLMALSARSLPRTAGLEDQFLGLTPDPLASTTAVQLRDAALRALAPRPMTRVALDDIAPLRASVRDAIDVVLAALPRGGPTTFRALTHGLRDRIDVIVRFLAVLELFKQGLVELGQNERFGDIDIRLIADPEQAFDAAAMDWGEGEARIVDDFDDAAPALRSVFEDDGFDELDDGDDLGAFESIDEHVHAEPNTSAEVPDRETPDREMVAFAEPRSGQ